MSDFDDLEALKRALQEQTPAPRDAARAQAVARAMENFDRRQESLAGARQTSDRPKTGFVRGVKTMFAQLSHRGFLTASTALVAVAVVVTIPALREGVTPPPVAVDAQFAPTSEVAEPRVRQVAPSESVGRAQGLAEPEAMPQSVVEEAYELSLADDSDVRDAEAPVAAAPVAKMLSRAEGQAVRPIVGDVPVVLPEADTEAYANAAPNPLKVTAEDPVSTFSVDVDTASYAIVRNSLLAGQLPPRDAVRVEEIVNYFPYDYPAPEGDAAFATQVSVVPTPWNSGTQLVQIGIQGTMPAVEDRPALNLVFLIDTSGSMNQPDKLPLLIQSFRLMLGQLRPEDEVAIVTYAGSAGQVLAPTPAAERATILAALDRLQAGGGTAGQAGLQQAYDLADRMTSEGEVSRVVLATDGDFNIGLSDPDALKDYIATKREGGTYLSVLGFGRGNLDDATMQALAQNGNGQAAYIDTLSEAQKVLVDQLTGALFPIANDVKIQVEFNPATVAEYRLIGYETRALRREDFNNDRVDAGDIGAGHQVTALYEITPVGSEAVRNTPLRYAPQDVPVAGSDELGFLKLRYKAPGETVSRLIETSIQPGGEVSAGFAVAMAGFAQLLRGSEYLGDWGWEDALALAGNSLGDDPFGYRREALGLMRLGQSLSR